MVQVFRVFDACYITLTCLKKKKKLIESAHARDILTSPHECTTKNEIGCLKNLLKEKM